MFAEAVELKPVPVMTICAPTEACIGAMLEICNFTADGDASFLHAERKQEMEKQKEIIKWIICFLI